MSGGDLIREARKRAGLSQRQLAGLLATSQPAIARWESGATSPSFRRVVDAVRACGLDLGVRLVARDDEHALLIEEHLRLTPSERLARMTESSAAVDRLAAKARRPDGV